MTDFDLDRLGELWRQDPEPAEIERLRRSAASVSRRASRAQWADTVGALIVGAALIVIAVLNQNLKTLVVATTALLFILFGVVRNRKLREAEIRQLTGTTEEMLDRSIERASSLRKRIRFNLVLAPLAIPVFSLLTITRGPARGILTTRFHVPSQFLLFILAVAALVLAWMVIGYARTYLRTGAELERLERLRDAYRREQSEAE